MTRAAPAPSRRDALLAAARARRQGTTIYALARSLGRPYRRVFDAVKRLAAEGLLDLEPAVRGNRRALIVRAAAREAPRQEVLPEFLSELERLAFRALGARMARLGRRVRELRLFGSRARGAARWDSDLDVAVLVSGRRAPELERAIVAAFADIEWAAPFEGALRISPLVVFGRERRAPVHGAIEREGITVWKANA